MYEYENIDGDIFDENELKKLAEEAGLSTVDYIERYKIKTISPISSLNVPTPNFETQNTVNTGDFTPKEKDFEFTRQDQLPDPEFKYKTQDYLIDNIIKKVKSPEQQEEYNKINQRFNDPNFDIFEKETVASTVPPATAQGIPGAYVRTVKPSDFVRNKYDESLKIAENELNELHKKDPGNYPEPDSDEGRELLRKKATNIQRSKELYKSKSSVIDALRSSIDPKTADLALFKLEESKKETSSRLEERTQIAEGLRKRYTEDLSFIDQVIDIGTSDPNVNKDNAILLNNGKYIAKETYDELISRTEEAYTGFNEIKKLSFDINKDLSKSMDLDIIAEIFPKNYSIVERMDMQLHMIIHTTSMMVLVLCLVNHILEI